MLSHEELKRRALANRETRTEYEAQKPDFELLDKLLEARKRAGLTQGQVAEKMGTKATAITRLESASRRHSPKIETLRRYADAVGCRLNIELIPD
ncbi:MAG: helix-turn-helix transcriptional regulator [Gemmatimonadota bacterium]|nr:helix-turn-helix transcriptional regulator [Gemmatimonadota bacterium]